MYNDLENALLLSMSTIVAVVVIGTLLITLGYNIINFVATFTIIMGSWMVCLMSLNTRNTINY